MDRDIYDSLYTAYLQMHEGKQDLEKMKQKAAKFDRKSYKNAVKHASHVDKEETHRAKSLEPFDKHDRKADKHAEKQAKLERKADKKQYTTRGSNLMDKVAKRQGDVRRKAMLKSKFRGSNSGAFSRPD